MRGLAAVLAVGVSACAGPPASDAEVCRDVIARLCAMPRCAEVDVLKVPTNADCTATLTSRTGCIDDAFEFQNRSAFLSCRLPLIRNGLEIGTAPSCLDVDETFRNCPSMVTFFGGTP